MKGGSSNSDSNTSTTTEQYDERVAATDDAIVVQIDDGSSLTFTDPQAWDALEAAMGEYTTVLNTAVEFAGNANDKASGLVSDVLEQSQSEDRQNLKDLLKYGAVIAIGVTAAYKWKG